MQKIPHAEITIRLKAFDQASLEQALNKIQQLIDTLEGWKRNRGEGWERHQVNDSSSPKATEGEESALFSFASGPEKLQRLSWGKRSSPLGSSAPKGTSFKGEDFLRLGNSFSKVSLPTTTRTFTLLRSPHGHSKSREQFSLSSQKAIISLHPFPISDERSESSSFFSFPNENIQTSQSGEGSSSKNHSDSGPFRPLCSSPTLLPKNDSVLPFLYALMGTPFYGVKMQIRFTQTVSAKTLLWG